MNPFEQLEQLNREYYQSILQPLSNSLEAIAISIFLGSAIIGICLIISSIIFKGK